MNVIRETMWERLSKEEFDLIVVGGGIVGACVARDAVLRGLKVALFERRDFASATSGASSKLIHGGLRYLMNLEIGLVRESLRERRIWSFIAPHMVHSLPFLLPLGGGKKFREKLIYSLGLRAYDLLSYDRNKLIDPEKFIPAHKKISLAQISDEEPTLNNYNFKEALLFHDYQMFSPERLSWACLKQAMINGAVVLNYAEVVGFVREGKWLKGVKVRNLEDGVEISVKGRIVVNATGPWADQIIALATGEDPERKIIRSKGIHVLTKPLTKKYAVVVPGKGSHFFVLPWQGCSLLGTTDTVYQGNPDDVHVSEKELVEFLSVVNNGFPGDVKIKRGDVLFFYGGLRPIVEKDPTESEEEFNSYNASRSAEVFDHEETGCPGLITAVGGKWTTSRHLAERVVDKVFEKLGQSPSPCVTDSTPVVGGNIEKFSEFTELKIKEYSDFPPEVVRNLAYYYGTEIDEVIRLAREDSSLADPICDSRLEIGAQIVYAVRNEMAVHLSDVLFRRTNIGNLGEPGESAILKITDLMSHEFASDESWKEREKNAVRVRFVSWARTFVVVNPRAWGNMTGKLWPSIEKKLHHAIGPVRVGFTEKPGDGIELARKALLDGCEQIIAVGGDGTINEVVNGFFKNDHLINPEAVFAIVSTGTGRDFAKALHWPQDIDEQIEHLANTSVYPFDLGKLRFVNFKGEETTRYFVNIASFGLSGATDRAVNSYTRLKQYSGKLAFFLGMLQSLITYRNKPVRLKIDGHFDDVLDIKTVAVCNGQYFGSGMHISPNSRLDDGWFDVIVIPGISTVELLLNVKKVYSGTHLTHPKIMTFKAQKVVAYPAYRAGEVLLDVDGEVPGYLPATFEIIPQAINVRIQPKEEEEV
ncbi:MAG: FAD-dependent oxidoreductase [Candidatus Hydrogenedentes bacterium]|nr:FAD-dependent oxidoreductase [Candidatus Hydrogenedentota bacterium]